MINPYQSCQYALKKFPTNVIMRAIHAAHSATQDLINKPKARPNHVALDIISLPGVGKTSMVEDYCRQQGIWYYELNTAVTDAAEVFGFKQTVDGQTVWAPPIWWPKPGTVGVLNIDDGIFI